MAHVSINVLESMTDEELPDKLSGADSTLPSREISTITLSGSSISSNKASEIERNIYDRTVTDSMEMIFADKNESLSLQDESLRKILSDAPLQITEGVNPKFRIKPGTTHTQSLAVPSLNTQEITDLFEMNPEEMERLESALQSDQAKQILGENVTAMLDILSVDESEESPLSTYHTVMLDHNYAIISAPSHPAKINTEQEYKWDLNTDGSKEQGNTCNERIKSDGLAKSSVNLKEANVVSHKNIKPLAKVEASLLVSQQKSITEDMLDEKFRMELLDNDDYGPFSGSDSDMKIVLSPEKGRANRSPKIKKIKKASPRKAKEAPKSQLKKVMDVALQETVKPANSSSSLPKGGVQSEKNKPVVPATATKKQYPKRENRRPPGRLQEALQPDLFSAPDVIRRYSVTMEPKETSETMKNNAVEPICQELDNQSIKDNKKINQESESVSSEGTPALVIPLPETSIPKVQPKVSGRTRKKRKLSDSESEEVPRKVIQKKKESQVKERPVKEKPIKERPIKEKAMKERPTKENLEKLPHTVDDEEDDGDGSSDDESWNSEDDPDRLWCICKKPHNNRFMICCDSCEDWFHGLCVGVTKAMGKTFEDEGREWTCPTCKKKDREKAPLQELPNKPLLPSSKITKPSNPPAKVPTNRPASTNRFPNKKMGRKDTVEDVNVKQALVQPNSENSLSKVMFCIVCKKHARLNSIYCSDVCILVHAQSSNTVAKPVVKQGLKALTAGSVKQLCKENPKFDEDEDIQTKLPLSSSTKTTPLSQSKQVQMTIPKSQSPKSNLPKRGSKSIPSSPHDLKVSSPSPGSSKTTVKQTPAKVPVAKSPLCKPAAASPVKLKSAEKKADLKSNPRRASMDVSKVGPPPDDVDRYDGTETIRIMVRDTLHTVLLARLQECQDLKSIPDESVRKIGYTIEEELYALNKEVGSKYKAKYRSLVFNMKDPTNLTLFRKIADKSVTPYQLVRLSPEELASQQLAQWREQESKHQLEMIKKNELDLLALSRTFVMKTHKGEELIESNVQKITPLEFEIEKPGDDIDPSSVSSTSDSQETIDRPNTPDMKKEKSKDSNTHKYKVKSRSHSRKKESKSREKSSHRSSSSKHRSRNKDSRRKSDVVHDEKKGKTKEKVKTEIPPRTPIVKLEAAVLSTEVLQGVTIINVETEVPALTEVPVILSQSPVNEADVVHSPTTVLDSNSQVSGATVASLMKTESCQEVTSQELEADREPTSTVPDAVVWLGRVSMTEVSTFNATLKVVSGDDGNPCLNFPSKMDIIGRIDPDIVWQYISKMKRSGTKEIVVLRFQPETVHEKNRLMMLYNYLNTRNRFGVVGKLPLAIKDLYIMPLPNHIPVPQVLLPLDGPGFEDNRPHLLLGILVRSKVGGMQSNKAKAENVDNAPTRSYTPPLIGERSSTPVIKEHVRKKASKESKKVRVRYDRDLRLKAGNKQKEEIPDNGDEPYSPGEGEPDVLATPPTELIRRMEEINRQIAEQKEEIKNMCADESEVTVGDEEEAYSPSGSLTPPPPATPFLLPNISSEISLPANIQEILANIKKQSDAKLDLKSDPIVKRYSAQETDETILKPTVTYTPTTIKVPLAQSEVPKSRDPRNPEPPKVTSTLSKLSDAELLEMAAMEMATNDGISDVSHNAFPNLLPPGVEVSSPQGFQHFPQHFQNSFLHGPPPTIMPPAMHPNIPPPGFGSHFMPFGGPNYMAPPPNMGFNPSYPPPGQAQSNTLPTRYPQEERPDAQRGSRFRSRVGPSRRSRNSRWSPVEGNLKHDSRFRSKTDDKRRKLRESKTSSKRPSRSDRDSETYSRRDNYNTDSNSS